MVVDMTHTCRVGIVILVRLFRLHHHSRSLHIWDHLRHYLRGLRLLGGLLEGLGGLDTGLGVRVNIWVRGEGLKVGLDCCLVGQRGVRRQG